MTFCYPSDNPHVVLLKTKVISTKEHIHCHNFTGQATLFDLTKAEYTNKYSMEFDFGLYQMVSRTFKKTQNILTKETACGRNKRRSIMQKGKILQEQARNWTKKWDITDAVIHLCGMYISPMLVTIATRVIDLSKFSISTGNNLQDVVKVCRNCSSITRHMKAN